METLKLADRITDDVNGVLFVCVANSARSQMAEGIARDLAPESIVVYSAGSAPTGVNPHAVTAMSEIGIDISGHQSQSVDEIPLERVAVVVTLCAEAECPAVLLSGEVPRLHWPLPDPAAASEADKPASFRAVREQLRAMIATLF